MGLLLDARARRAIAQSLVEWWTTPVDYDGQVEYFAKRSLAGLIQFLVGGALLALGLVIAVAQFSVSAPPTHFARVLSIGLAVSLFVWAVVWWVGPWPSRRVSRFVLVYLDVGVLVTSLVNIRGLAGVFALSAMILVSFYIVFFDGPKIIVLHTIWITIAMVLISVQIAAEVNGDVPLIIARALAGTALAVAPVTTQFGIWVLRNDANEAEIDSLTGLLNRRGLFIHLTDFLRRGPTGSPEIMVAVVDLDRFKRVNDAFGHATGDEVLVRTGSRLNSVVDGRALVARVGGEEFVVVDFVGAGESRSVAESLRVVLARPADHASVTASVGFVGVPRCEFAGSGDPAEVLAALIARADGAMFTAKRAGGDNVVGADQPPTAAI